MEKHWGLFLLVFGLVFAGVGLVFVRRTRRLKRMGHRVPGQVERVNWNAGNSGLIGYPVLLFRTVDGRDLRVESDVGLKPCPVREGQPVTVVYDPAKPEIARAEQMLSAGTALGVIFLILGTAVAVGGTVVAANTYI
jgi:hypothetical protein